MIHQHIDFALLLFLKNGHKCKKFSKLNFEKYIWNLYLYRGCKSRAVQFSEETKNNAEMAYRSSNTDVRKT